MTTTLYGNHPPLAADAACVLCGSQDRLVTDHCHTHGWVRGVLCKRCNYYMRYVDQKVRPANGADPVLVTWEALAAYTAHCGDCPPLEAADLEIRVLTPPPPGNRRDQVVCIKFANSEVEPIDQEAIKRGLVHVDGSPIRSDMVRKLVAEALATSRH